MLPPQVDGLLRRGDAQEDGVLRLLRQLRQDGTGHGDIPILPPFRPEADAVSEGHLHEALGHPLFHGPGSLYLPGPGQGQKALPGRPDALGPLPGEEIDRVAGGLELRAQDLSRQDGGDGKGQQSGRHVPVQEGTGHGVLAADGGAAEVQLGIQGPQQGGEGLAPAPGLPAQLLKEFLQGQVRLAVIAAGGGELGERQADGLPGPPVGVPLHPPGIKAPGHDAALVRVLPRQHRKQRRHGLSGGPLILSAVGHQEAPGADAGVKALGEAPAGSALQAARHLAEGRGGLGGLPCRCAGRDGGVLGGTVGVQEDPGEVHDGLSPPAHHHPGLLRHHGHPVSLQVLPLGGGQESRLVLRGQDHGHPLLGLGDGKLRAVQTVVLLADSVQVDGKTVRQLADGHADTAGAEIIAALDKAGDVPVPEEALELPLLRGVALLDFAGHGLEGLGVVPLGRAGGPADAVPAGAAAQQDHHIPGGRTLPADVARRGGGHHGAAFQVLGDVALVIDLRHMAGGKADLVAVGGVARRRGLAELPLGKLAGKGLTEGLAGVTAAGDAHGLVDIGPAGEGVPDAAADAGGRPAEGLDLRGVVVGLVLEHQEPVLLLPIHLCGNVDGAGVDLLALVQLRELAPLFEDLGSQGGDVHQGLGTPRGLFLPVDLLSEGKVAVIGRLNGGVLRRHPVQMGGEGGVAAVIGPVGIHHTELRDGGVPALRVPEPGLEEGQVVAIHGEAHSLPQGGETGGIQGGEAREDRHICRDGGLLAQGLGQFQGSLPALHRVDDVALHSGHVLRRQGAVENVDLGGADGGALPLAQKLDTLGGGVRPLVKLPRQGLHGKDGRGIRGGKRLRDGIQLGL